MLYPKAPGQTVSFRHLLTEAISGFLEERGMSCPETANALAELVVTLSRYQEEGAPLYPLVIICDDLASMLNALHGRDPIRISAGPRSRETMRRALKQCASLGQGPWAIYFQREENALSYGVFRTDAFVLTETPLRMLRSIKEPTLKVIGVLQLAENIIELSGSANFSRYIHLSGARTDVPHPTEVLATMVDAICADVPEPLVAPTQAFYRRVLFQMMQSPHGSLAAVLSRTKARSDLFADGIILQPPLDVVAHIEAYLSDPREEKATSLQALLPLIKGMFSADGVVVLRSDGSVVGYNVFVQQQATTKNSGVPIGGARRRTYDVLCRYLGTELVAAFYRSQDGHALCKRDVGPPED